MTGSGFELSPRRLHPVSPFIGLIFQSRQLVVPLLIGLVAGARNSSGNDSSSSFTRYLFFGLPAVFALIQFLDWGRFRYSVTGEALVIDKGFLNRSHREIPLERIHHVEEVAKLAHRVFGVVRLVVDSGAGGSAAEARLDALSKREAAILRAILEGRPAEPGPVVGRSGSVPPLVKLSPTQLFFGGITNISLLPTLTIIGTVTQLIDEVVPDDQLVESAVEQAPLTILGAVTGLALLTGVWMVIAGLGGLVSNYGFVLERRNHEVRTQRGLLDRRRAVADLRRLTAIRVSETLSRRALGLCDMQLQTISGTSTSSGVGRLSIPVLPRSRVPELVGQFLEGAESLPELSPHPRAARRRLIVQRTTISLAGAIPLAWFWRPWGVFVGGLLIALAVVRAEVAYRHLGHGTEGGILVTQSGGLRRRQAVTAWSHAESTRITSSPLQRWAGLATLKVDLPQGSSVAVVDADPTHLAALRQLAFRRPPAP